MPSVGIDISDNSIKFLELRETKDGLRIGRFGEEDLPAGIVVAGRIQKGAELTKVLAKLRREHGFYFVRATLPEESGYIFELSLPDMTAQEMTSTIEFRLEENVPISPAEAIFGYDLLSSVATKEKDKKGKPMRRAVVSVFPRVATETYAKIFYDAGLVPLSLETEPQAIARAMVPNGDMDTYLIVDIGRARSGVSIVSGGAVRFATTTEIGGDLITKAFKKHFHKLSDSELTLKKNNEGLRVVREENDSELSGSVETVVEQLIGKIQEHMRYWNTRGEEGKPKPPAVKKVFLCGGNSNIGGLPERLSHELKLPVKLANVWANTFSLDTHIPKGISFYESLGYAPAIGLALHGIHPVMRNRHMANLLPQQQLIHVRKERRGRMLVVSLISLLVTIILGGALLIPSLLLSHSKAVSAERKIQLTREFISQREETGVLEGARNIRSRIDRLEGVLNDTVFSNVFSALDDSVPSGVRLSSISYSRSEQESDTITVRGVASTRDVLLSFIRQLEREPMLTGVDLPVSNLAQSTDIQFALALKVAIQE